MAEPPQQKLSKRERREARQRAGRRRRLRTWLLRGALGVAFLVGLGLWQVDLRGREEIVDAEVVGSRMWPHRGTDGRTHSHQRVTLELEGLVRATVDRGDDLELGQIVPVRIRRGRWSGRPYFLAREPVEADPEDEAPGDDAPTQESARLEGPG